MDLPIVVLIVCLVLLVILINRSAEQRNLLSSLNDRITDLSKEISRLKQEYKQKQEPSAQSEWRPRKETQVTPMEERKPVEKKIPEIERARPEEPVIKQAPLPPKESVFETSTTRAPRKKENTDIEKFIGENLANKIGIAVLVLGIAFFVKYAIDKNWINESGRVLIGLVCGAVLIGFAHYFRNSYRSFSSVLVGGGLTVFYFSIAFAFHQYHLIGQFAAFIIMVLISAFGVLLSLYYNRQELAILSTIGGFITPFLVSTGQENYIALFTYLCILNTGLMVLAWFKRWPAINIIALFFTTIIYGGWLVKRTIFDDAEFPRKDALLFGTLFYLLFVAMNIINSIRLRKLFTAFDFVLLLLTNFLYYLVGMIILGYWQKGDYQGLFTVLLGIFNLSLAFIFSRTKTTDPNFVKLLFGLAISFISLAIPVQFQGNYIVLFWAAETVVLLWLFQLTRMNLLKVASLVVGGLMIFSLLLNWSNVYSFDEKILPILLNKGFVTTIFSSLSLFVCYYLLRKEKEEYFLPPIPLHLLQKIVLGLACLVGYAAGAWEIWYQFFSRYPGTMLQIIYLQAYSFAFALLMLRVFKDSAYHALLKFGLTAFCLAFYLAHIGTQVEVSYTLLKENQSVHFIAHWIGSLILLWLLYDLIVYFFSAKEKLWLEFTAPFTWITATGIVIVLSAEMYLIMLWNFYSTQTDWQWWQNLYYKAGLSMLWGFCSFIMMWLGMKKKFRPLRIISLTLFTITIIKLFTYDIRRIPPGGKIAAFILLGILLLAVSFMYQRLKKIIIDNSVE